PVDLPVRVSVDPVLGRVAFPAGATPAGVRVGFAHGFSGDLGGGPYDRTESTSEALLGTVDWQIGVSRRADPVPGQIVNTLSQAVAAWNDQPPGTIGVIAVMDSATYRESLTGGDQVTIADGSQLLIVAAGWPETEDPETPGRRRRTVGRFVPDGLRPHLLGDLSLRGAPGGSRPGTLAVDGLLIEGRV